MDITRALQRAVKGFRLGTGAMAAAMGVYSDKVLLAKVDPNREETHASPEQMQQIMEISGDYGALHVMATQLNHQCLRNPGPDEFEGEDARRAIADTLLRAADAVKKAIEAEADGTVTATEKESVSAAVLHLMASANTMRAYIAWKHEQSKAPNLRRVA